MSEIITWDNFSFPDWVPEQLKQQIIIFWSCFGRNYKDWVANAKRYEGYGKLGDSVRFHGLGDSNVTGRLIHCYNNMAALVGDQYHGGYIITPYSRPLTRADLEIIKYKNLIQIAHLLKEVKSLDLQIQEAYE